MKENPFVQVLMEYLESPDGKAAFMQAIDREYQQMNTKTAGDPLPL